MKNFSVVSGKEVTYLLAEGRTGWTTARPVLALGGSGREYILQTDTQPNNRDVLPDGRRNAYRIIRTIIETKERETRNLGEMGRNI